jgi:hypothetical protein
MPSIPTITLNDGKVIPAIAYGLGESIFRSPFYLL